MSSKASRKKKNANDDFDYIFAPKGGLASSSPITGSRRRSPRIKMIADRYGAYDFNTSSEHELDSSDNSSCDSYHIKVKSIEEVYNTFSIGTWNNKRTRSKRKKRKASNSEMLEKEIDPDEPLISLEVTKGNKRHKLFKSTEGSSVDKLWMSKEASFQEFNNVTEGEDENGEVLPNKNIFETNSTHDVSASANNLQSSSEIKFSLVEGEELNSENQPKPNQETNHEDQNYPKNLLQNRKEFSPISQEKLCRYDDELDDTVKALGHVTDSIPSPEITKRRLKKNRKLPHRPKDCSDGNSLCTQTSIDTPSQKAVLFSQMQMKDTEKIASKLLKEMSCLKNIVADIMNTDNVASEACKFSFSKFTPEEITAAVGSASNLEVTTEKWLAMMSRDCNRFCKIMGSTESKVSTPVTASKQSRKVTFADEAGGSLCHVKVFEQPPSADTQVEPKNDNQTS